MQQGHVRNLFLLAGLMASACATPAPDRATREGSPAAAAVVFDKHEATPVIVEGLANRETGRILEANDPVRIASISKLVMALTALRLAEEGKVRLTADISQYLGWDVRNPAYPQVPVTLAQLLSHRSGLRDAAGYVVPLGESLQAKLAEPGAWYADAPPGEAPFEYANLGSPVVATVLEAASGERYDRLVERLIFAPLGIDACLNWIGCSPDAAARAVTLYRSTGEVARDDAADLPPNCTIPIARGTDCSLEGYVPGTNASIFSPQGGVRIGMTDLARLGQELIREDSGIFSQDAMQPARLALMAGINPGEEFFCTYGLGMQVIEAAEAHCEDDLFADGASRLGHAGEAYGLRSGLWFTTGDNPRGIAYFITAVPDRTAPDEGGFAPEEVAFVRRAMEKAREAGK